MNKKALFLDLDGTLLNDSREITEGNRNAIDQALDLGHKVIITTGRPLVSALAQAEKLGLTKEGCYVISFNGGMIYDMGTKSIVYQKTVGKDLVQKVYAEAAKRQIHLQTYDAKKIIVVDGTYNPDYVDRYCAKTGMKDYQVLDSVDLLKEEPCKMLAIDYKGRTELEGLISWVQETCAGEMNAFFSCKEYVEVIPVGLGKGNAVKHLAKILGIPMEDTISAGDEENDLSMIQDAGTGCAMANAVPAVKAAADYITVCDNNHDGIKEIIERFMM